MMTMITSSIASTCIVSEQPLHPTLIDVQSDHSLRSSKDNSVYTSLTASTDVMEDVFKLQDGVVLNDSSDEEVEIVEIRKFSLYYWRGPSELYDNYLELITTCGVCIFDNYRSP